MKILISSSNNPRFQSNANVPINDGEFFRRKPGDAQTYIYNGIEYAPRIAVQRIAFSPEYPTQIILPVHGTSKVVSVKNHIVKNNTLELNIFPNPSSDLVNFYPSKTGQYNARIYNTLGELLQSADFTEILKLDVKNFSTGQYLIEIKDVNDPSIRVSKPFTKI